jgi:hypothetical protein
MVRDKMANYERVERQFSKFFDIEELESHFDRKADMELIQEINNSKATNNELKIVQGHIEKLNERIRQVAILQNEIA